MTQQTDEPVVLSELLDRFHRGEKESLDGLIQHSCRRFENLARQMLRGYPALRRWVETDDVLQSAMMRLVRALETVKPESARHFLSLATLQLRRELIDLTRHYFGPHGAAANHHSTSDEDAFSLNAIEPEDLSHEPGALAQWRELHEKIAALPEEEREITELVYYQGLSRAEAARVLEVSTRTAQRRWHQALETLHRELAGGWPE